MLVEGGDALVPLADAAQSADAMTRNGEDNRGWECPRSTAGHDNSSCS